MNGREGVTSAHRHSFQSVEYFRRERFVRYRSARESSRARMRKQVSLPRNPTLLSLRAYLDRAEYPARTSRDFISPESFLTKVRTPTCGAATFPGYRGARRDRAWLPLAPKRRPEACRDSQIWPNSMGKVDRANAYERGSRYTLAVYPFTERADTRSASPS